MTFAEEVAAVVGEEILNAPLFAFFFLEFFEAIRARGVIHTIFIVCPCEYVATTDTLRHGLCNATHALRHGLCLCRDSI